MKKHFIRYATQFSTLEDAALFVGNVLSLKFDRRSSGYIGDYLLHRSSAFEKFSIEPNHFDGDVREEAYPDFSYIIYITLDESSSQFSEDKNVLGYQLSEKSEGIRLIKIKEMEVD